MIDTPGAQPTAPSPTADAAAESSSPPIAPANEVGPAQHVARVAALIARRLHAAADRPFTLADAERINQAAGWTYRYLAPSGHVVRARAVSLPTDDLVAAWRLALVLAKDDVAA
jgi:hypothetical protein